MCDKYDIFDIEAWRAAIVKTKELLGLLHTVCDESAQLPDNITASLLRNVTLYIFFKVINT